MNYLQVVQVIVRTPVGQYSDGADNLAAELSAIKGEALGWLPLAQGTYFHHGDPSDEDSVVVVVGAADVRMAGMNVLLLG